MNPFITFVVEILASLGISYMLIRLLRPHLRDVLKDICGTGNRADFWVMFTQLMLVISPLLIVVYFAPSQSLSVPETVEEFRRALFRMLLGDFIALSAIGQLIWKSIGSTHPEMVTVPKEEVG